MCPPDSQEIEQSQVEHERAIKINQQQIKNKHEKDRSITEYTKPLSKPVQPHPEASDLHLDTPSQWRRSYRNTP